MNDAGSRGDFEAAAWSWVEHLCSGGTTTWRKWRASEHAGVPARWAVLPSAAQLEVIRRLADPVASTAASAAAGPGPVGARDLAGLADLVAGTPVGGRGLVDAPLPWAGSRSSAGAPAVEPDQLPARELLRVCVAAIARSSLSAGPAPVAPRRVRRRPWHRAFRVVGISPHADAVRRALLEAGQVEGGRRPTVLVVGAPLDAMMAMHWRQRVEGGAGVRWRRLWSGAAARGELPPSVDLAAAARPWAERSSAENVHVVLEPGIGDAVSAAGKVLDLRLAARGAPGSDVVETDLLRRLNQVLGVRGSAATRALLDGSLGFAFRGPWTRPLGVPVGQLGWAVEQARAMAARLGDGPFAVHGDCRVVVPSSDASLPRSVDPRDTLGRAVEVLAGCGMVTTVQSPLRRGGH